MALPLPPGLTPAEGGFLAEMELVTVIPRQRLDSLALLGGPSQPLRPPFPAQLPLWLALLLKRQKRADISPPPWLSGPALTAIRDAEQDGRGADVFTAGPPLPPLATSSRVHHDDDGGDGYLSSSQGFEPSPPFLPHSSTARATPDALPYHWQETAHLLLTHAGDDVRDADGVRRALRDLRDVRLSKLRRGFRVLEPGAGVQMNGVGALEVAEVRGFVEGVVDGLRKINRSREESRREREAEDRESGRGGTQLDDDDDDDMQL